MHAAGRIGSMPRRADPESHHVFLDSEGSIRNATVLRVLDEVREQTIAPGFPGCYPAASIS